MEPSLMPRQLRAIYDLLSIEDVTAFEGDKPEKIVQWLYRILDILDSKTSHLLRLNAIIFAAQAFLVNGILGASAPPRGAMVASVLFLLMPFLGTIASMWIFRVAWPFLNWQAKKSPLITERAKVEVRMRHEFIELAKICDRRTSMHRVVWWFTMVSIVLLVPSVWIRLWVV